MKKRMLLSTITILTGAAVFALLALAAGIALEPRAGGESRSSDQTDSLKIVMAKLETLERELAELKQNELEATAKSEPAAAQSTDQQLARIADKLENLSSSLNQASDRWLRQISQDLGNVSSELYNIRRVLEQGR